ncbi:MAG: phasin family protein [Proteobacteria bacterium]|nr:phasin family protein [Pseudomonadota bacterium]
MAKKKLKKKVQSKPTVHKSVNPVVDSVREIWLAGLGAFSVAQQEGGKIIEQGNKMFDQLVAEGSKLEKRTRKDVEGAVDDLRSDIESRVGDIRSGIESRVNEFRGDVESRLGGVREQAESVRKQASDNWGKLENIFEDRVSRSLANLGIPTRDDVKDLAERVQKLSRQVAAMGEKAKPAAKKTVVKKTAAKMAAAKKAKVKKTVVKKAAVKKAEVKKADPKAPKAA